MSAPTESEVALVPLKEALERAGVEFLFPLSEIPGFGRVEFRAIIQSLKDGARQYSTQYWPKGSNSEISSTSVKCHI
jgi:hypothetical protein